MSIDECLNPCAGLIVLYLNYVREHGRAILKDEKFKGGWMIVILSVNEFFGFRYSIGNGDTRLGRSDTCCGAL